jgi:CHAT domain-containing protein
VQNLLDEKTLFLEYFVSDSMVHFFAVSKKSIELFRTPINTLELRKKIEGMRLALTNYKYVAKKSDKAYSLYTETAYWFYQKLLKKALDGKSVEHLIIVTDGEFGHLPFEAFLMERGRQGQNDYAKLHYVVNDYNVSYNYSATLWKDILEGKPRNNNHKMLAYGANYPHLSAEEEGAENNSLESRAPPIVKLRNVLNSLAEVAGEVKTLEDIFQGKFVYYENEIDKKDMLGEGFFKENTAEYGVVHLAMHGLIHPRVLMLSSLAFTENGDSLEDNFLQAYEISRLNLNADLVVLLACETGYGEF